MRRWVIVASGHHYLSDFARPLAPENGLIKLDGILKVGRMVKFHCKSGFMMEGQPVMTCSEGTEDGIHVGKWTGEIPTCVRACTYPGIK